MPKSELPQFLRDFRERMIIEMRKQGYSSGDITKVFRISKASVIYIFKKAGLVESAEVNNSQ